MNTLIATSSSDNFVDGSMVLLSTLSKHLDDFNNLDVKVFYEDFISPLSAKNMVKIKSICPYVQFEQIYDSRYHHLDAPSNRRKSAYLTLEAFSQEEYDKVLFFDSDVLIINNISELINEKSDLSAALAGRKYNLDELDTNRFFPINTGVLVIGNNLLDGEIHNDLLDDAMKLRKKVANADQEVINNYFEDKNIDLNILPYEYNWRYTLDMEIPKNVKIIHFSGYDSPKPWSNKEINLPFAYNIWNKEYEELKNSS